MCEHNELVIPERPDPAHVCNAAVLFDAIVHGVQLGVGSTSDGDPNSTAEMQYRRGCRTVASGALDLITKNAAPAPRGGIGHGGSGLPIAGRIVHSVAVTKLLDALDELSSEVHDMPTEEQRDVAELAAKTIRRAGVPVQVSEELRQFEELVSECIPRCECDPGDPTTECARCRITEAAEHYAGEIEELGKIRAEAAADLELARKNFADNPNGYHEGRIDTLEHLLGIKTTAYPKVSGLVARLAQAYSFATGGIYGEKRDDGLLSEVESAFGFEVERLTSSGPESPTPSPSLSLAVIEAIDGVFDSHIESGSDDLDRLRRHTIDLVTMHTDWHGNVAGAATALPGSEPLKNRHFESHAQAEAIRFIQSTDGIAVGYHPETRDRILYLIERKAIDALRRRASAQTVNTQGSEAPSGGAGNQTGNKTSPKTNTEPTPDGDRFSLVPPAAVFLDERDDLTEEEIAKMDEALRAPRPAGERTRTLELGSEPDPAIAQFKAKSAGFPLDRRISTAARIASDFAGHAADLVRDCWAAEGPQFDHVNEDDPLIAAVRSIAENAVRVADERRQPWGYTVNHLNAMEFVIRRERSKVERRKMGTTAETWTTPPQTDRDGMEMPVKGDEAPRCSGCGALVPDLEVDEVAPGWDFTDGAVCPACQDGGKS